MNDRADSVWEWTLRNNPPYATFLGDRRFDDRLPEIGPGAVEAQLGFLKRERDLLRAADMSKLAENDRVTRDALLHSVDSEIQEREYKFHYWNIDQMMGPQVWLGEMVNYHKLTSARDVANLVTRFYLFAANIESYISNLLAGIREKRVAPRIAVERVIGQLDGMLATGPAESPFVSSIKDAPFKEGLDAIPVAVRDGVFPALTRLRDFLKKEYIKHAREEVGLWALPQGDESYAYRVRFHTTTNLTPDQLHDIGHEELKSILGEMKAIASKLGHNGDIPSFFAKLKADRTNFWATRGEIVQHFERVLAKANQAAPEWFGILPKTPCIVKPIEEYREKDCVAAFYYQPPVDLSRPGIFYANTHDPAARLKINNAALTIHEAVPGHHLQIAISCEMKNLHPFRRNCSFTAFIEGWALYTERLGDEMGLYENDLERFGMLTYQAWRACRLVVDTGLHSKKWSREKAIEFFRANINLSEAEITNEVDRYIIWPGQALAYKVGQREISRLRADAKQKLGSKFDIRQFHDVVLRNGALPLTTLGSNVDAWVKSKA